MDSTKILLLILGMAVVIYIPRAIPVVLVDKMKFGVKTEKCLKLIPYTAMSALIFPVVSGVDVSNPVIGITGGLVTGILVWRKYPVMVSVLATIGTDFILHCFL